MRRIAPPYDPDEKEDDRAEARWDRDRELGRPCPRLFTLPQPKQQPKEEACPQRST